ncbi:MAG: hypothetical protein HYU85_00320 [Chloroflexi bacterium]|nr:hypothetical protein [Chloroflexota bacterium]MBI3041002.1 hypothetical protein [Chloroflexota bacterium]MBI3930679.1 hypothetical protein [Chloroflexota bacterium]
MKRGFMELAVEIVKKYPGLTAQEVAEEALGSSSDLSDSKNPLQSLETTLDKQVREGREPRIIRERFEGKYRFFPATMSSASNSKENVLVQLSLPTQELKDIDNLVTVGKFENRSSAIRWLALEGIKANRAYLDKVADTKNQIERLKRDI